MCIKSKLFALLAKDLCLMEITVKGDHCDARIYSNVPKLSEDEPKAREVCALVVSCQRLGRSSLCIEGDERHVDRRGELCGICAVLCVVFVCVTCYERKENE
jgi:hypothetical protein